MTKTRKVIYAFIALTIPFYFLAFITRGEVLSSLLFGAKNDTFADFIKPMFHWGGNPYTNGVECNYPALNVILLSLLRRFISPETIASVSKGMELRNWQDFWLIFAIYNVIIIWIISVSASNLMKNDKESFLVVMLALSLSFPVLFALERANLINLAFALTIFFISFYKDERKVVREVSLLALALAFALKIYPAIFGLLLIKDKRWKEAARTCVYAVVAFVAPFLAYGKESLFIFIRNLRNFSNDSLENGYAYNFSLSGIIRLIGRALGFEANSVFVVVILAIVVIMWLIMFSQTEAKWKEYMALSVIMIMIPNPSATYTLIFLIPAFICFCDSLSSRDGRDTGDKTDIVMGILLGILFAPLGLPLIRELSVGNYNMSWSYVLYYSFFIIILILGSIQGGKGITTLIKRVKTYEKQN